MSKRQRTKPWSFLLSLQYNVRVCKVMREFLILPELMALGRTCKSVHAEAKAECTRQVVPIWDGVSDPNEALERSRLWYKSWKSRSTMTSRKTSVGTDQIRIEYPGSQQSMIFVTPVHRQLCPGRYELRGSPFAGHVDWHSEFAYEQAYWNRKSHLLHVPVWHWKSPEAKQLEDPRCADFVDVFLDDLAVSMCDFALHHDPPLHPWSQILRSEFEELRSHYNPQEHGPSEALHSLQYCQLLVREGKPLGAPTGMLEVDKRRLVQCRHAILTAPGSQPIPPLFSAISGERLTGEHGVLRRGDVTADLFTISVTTYRNSYEFRLKWCGSILFQRGDGAAPAADAILEFDDEYDAAVYNKKIVHEVV